MGQYVAPTVRTIDREEMVATVDPVIWIAVDSRVKGIRHAAKGGVGACGGLHREVPIHQVDGALYDRGGSRAGCGVLRSLDLEPFPDAVEYALLKIVEGTPRSLRSKPSQEVRQRVSRQLESRAAIFEGCLHDGRVAAACRCRGGDEAGEDEARPCTELEKRCRLHVNRARIEQQADIGAEQSAAGGAQLVEARERRPAGIDPRIGPRWTELT